MGFSHRYTVGVWLGNLNQEPMHGVTGAIGPALVLRAVFAELNHRIDSRPLYVSPHLVSVTHLSPQRTKRDHQLPPHAGMVFTWHSAEAPMSHVSTAAQPPTRRLTTFRAYIVAPTHTGSAARHGPTHSRRSRSVSLLPTQKINPVKTQWLVDGHRVGQTPASERKFLWPLTLQRHLIFSHVLSFICPFHHAHTVLDQDG